MTDIYTQIEQQNGEAFAKAIREYDDEIFKIPGIVDMLEYAGQEATEPLIEYLHRFRVENCPILKQKSYITKGFIRIRDQEGKDRIIHYHREERGYYFGPKCYVKDGVLSKVNPDSEILLEHFVLNLEDGTVKDVYDTLGDHVKNVPPNDAFRELLENTINGKKIKIREDEDGVQHLLADGQEVLTMKDGHLLSMNIHDGVTEIGRGAFACFSSLQSVNIEGVRKIGVDAFWGCTCLQSVHNTERLTEIGAGAFSHCFSLKSIDIPEGVTKIEAFAFTDCYSIKSIVIPKTVTEIGYYAFEGCYSLESINIPEGVTKIGFGAFFGCTSLKSIVIPKMVTKIEDMTFAWCSSLESIDIPEGVTEIGKEAFKGCTSLKSIDIRGVRKIGKDAFEGCNNLTITCTKAQRRMLLKSGFKGKMLIAPKVVSQQPTFAQRLRTVLGYFSRN